MTHMTQEREREVKRGPAPHTQGTSTMPPPDFGARANFSRISIENTTLAIQQI